MNSKNKDNSFISIKMTSKIHFSILVGFQYGQKGAMALFMTETQQPARIVFCKKLGREAEALTEPPMFGALGQEIFENISKEAWAEWSEMQLKIVNEYHLDLSEKPHRKTLEKQLRAFLSLDGEDAEAEVLSVGEPTEK